MTRCPNCQKDNKNSRKNGIFCSEWCRSRYDLQNQRVKKRKVFGETCCICGVDASCFYKTLTTCKSCLPKLKSMNPLRLLLKYGRIKT